MPGMTAAETASCIKHHLALAGRSDPLFTDGTITLIPTTSRSYLVPSTTSAAKARRGAYATGKSLADEPAARAAVNKILDE